MVAVVVHISQLVIFLNFFVFFINSAPSWQRAPSSLFSANFECGKTNRQHRLVGGNETKSNEFPWVAALSHNGEFHCGAALISQRHLLTAAHCVTHFAPRHLSVTLGDHDRGAIDAHRFQTIQVFGVRSVRMHEHFDMDSFNNDIAVIELTDAVVFNNRVSPVCLPNVSDDNDDVEDGGALYNDLTDKMAVVTGWGRVGERGETSKVLRKISVPIWSQERCFKSGYGEHKITGNMFCAGYAEGMIDSCQGDSGGPMQMANAAGNMEIIGVVSWGRGCARPNLPGIYTKVSNYLHWIDEQMNINQ